MAKKIGLKNIFKIVRKNKNSLIILSLLFLLITGILIVSKKTSEEKPQTQTSSRANELRIKTLKTVVFSFKPEKTTVKIGEEFKVDVIVDAGSNKVTAVDTEILIPKSLEVTKVEPGNFLPTQILTPKISDGSVKAVYGARLKQPKTGAGTLMSLTLKTLSLDQAAKIEFSSNTKAAGIGESQDITQSLNPTVIVISQ